MKFTFKIWEKIKEAWALYKINLGSFLLFALVTFILSFIGQEDNFILSIIMMFINFLVSFIWIKSSLNVVDGGEFKPFSKEILPSWKSYWYFISTTILTTLMIIVGLFILIVPGLYLIGRLMLASYIAVDKNKNAIEAIKESWDMTKDNGWKIFWKSFVIGLFIIVGFIALFFGIFITYPIGVLVLAMLYREFFKFKKNGIVEEKEEIKSNNEEVIEETITIIQEEGSPVVEVIDEKITKVSE